MTTPSKTHNKSFSQSLSLTFVGSALILLLAGGFALYLMGQLGTAVERALEEILPKTLVAMRLSEHSALLAASAPSLTNARNPHETEQVATGLDDLKKEIERNVAILAETSASDQLEQIRNNVAILAATLSSLKSATNQRITLDEKRASAIARIRDVHSEFSDTVSPVVWGVSSLTRLLGKRTARTNAAKLKALRNRHVERLILLMQLQLAYQELLEPKKADSTAARTQSWDNFDAAWKRVQAMLETSANKTDLLARQLSEKGTRFHATWENRHIRAGVHGDTEFKTVLAQARADALDELAQQFASALHTTEATIAAFVDQSVKDMGYALDIKAEGNLSFAL